jgi:hypothetical protein
MFSSVIVPWPRGFWKARWSSESVSNIDFLKFISPISGPPALGDTGKCSPRECRKEAFQRTEGQPHAGRQVKSRTRRRSAILLSGRCRATRLDKRIVLGR